MSMVTSRGDRGAVSIDYVGIGAAVIVIVGALLVSGVGAAKVPGSLS